MLNASQISLNAVRIFVAVAEDGSIKSAADRLGVTPGAVSQQIRGLEGAMGVALLERTHNSIRLTLSGEVFYQHAQQSLNDLNRAIESAMTGSRDLTVLVSTTLATRWLIPALPGFRKRWPDVSVRIETSGQNAPARSALVDVILDYVPISHPLEGADILFRDECRPYLSPSLLAQNGNSGDIACYPALQSSSGNWDWDLWLQEAAVQPADLTIGGAFDLDDAALRAAIAGMGMVLSSDFIIRDDLEADRLRPLPGSPKVLLGHYTVKLSAPIKPSARHFAKWLRSL